MARASDPASEAEHVRRLEEALAEYAMRYGLTDRARAALKGPAPLAERPSVVARLGSRFPLFRAVLRPWQA